MKAKHLFPLCLLAGFSQLSLAKIDDRSWLTIVGSTADPDSDTILIDPKPLDMKGQLRWMTLRLNRARQRTSTDGIVFRSFTSVIEFDCEKRTARFTKTQFYNGPAVDIAGSNHGLSRFDGAPDGVPGDRAQPQGESHQGCLHVDAGIDPAGQRLAITARRRKRRNDRPPSGFLLP